MGLEQEGEINTRKRSPGESGAAVYGVHNGFAVSGVVNPAARAMPQQEGHKLEGLQGYALGSVPKGRVKNLYNNDTNSCQKYK